jgi:hypothetical protein
VTGESEDEPAEVSVSYLFTVRFEKNGKPKVLKREKAKDEEEVDGEG